ncbi:hypothetical protein WJX77_006967 [Trebouxia sp. C0004]
MRPLEDAGATGAIQTALVGLFARRLLPANPFPYLAEVASGSADQKGVWRLTDRQVVEKLQDGGSAVVANTATDLATLSQFDDAWGLPHVLACVCCKGVDTICSVLANNLPASYFPSFSPSDPDADGYSVQVLPSLQGRCISYQPDWQPFPLLEVRADVVVVGPVPLMATVKLARLIVRDAADMTAKGHYVQALVMQAPPQANGTIPFYTQLSLEQLADKENSVMQLLAGGMQDNSCIVCSMVVAVQVPKTGAAKGRKEWRHMPATKSYHLHVGVQAAPVVFSNNLPPIDSLIVAPHDALFTGLFLQEAAARRYVGLNRAVSPYSQVLPNMTIMLQQLALNYAAGQFMWAYNTLMLLAFMLDPRLTGAVPGPNPNLDPNGPAMAALGLAGLPQLLDLVIAYEDRLGTAALKESSQRLEDSSESGSDSGSRSASDSDTEADPESRSIRNVTVQVDSSAGSQSDAEPRLASPAASLGPLLIRMQNGLAAALTGMAEELQSLQWLIDRLQADAGLSPEIPDKLMQHLHSLFTRILQVAPHAMAPGGQAVMQGVLAEALQPLTQAAEQAASSLAPENTSDCSSLLASLSTPCAKLQSVMSGLAMTHAHKLLHRAPDVGAFASQLKIDLHLLDIKTGSEASAWLAPDWVVDVKSESDARKESGDLPEQLAVEGVMLQYAVDTRLHDALQEVHQMLVRPPVPINPFPAVSNIFLQYSCRLDLWDSRLGDVSLLHNQISRLQDTAFMYKATPAMLPTDTRSSPVKSNKRWPVRSPVKPPVISPVRQPLPKLNSAADDVPVAVFGCYAAVALADVTALQLLPEKLLSLFKHCTWQTGAYQVDVVPTVVGDAAISNAFALHHSRLTSATASTSASTSAVRSRGRAVPLYLHERGFGMVTEEHYLIAGPNYSEAVQLFISAFQAWLENMHIHTEQVINSMQVGNGKMFSLDELRSRPKAVANSIVQWLKTKPIDAAVAEVNMCAAPTPEGYQQPEGVQRPLYAALVKKVMFQYQGVKKIRLGRQHWDSTEEEDSGGLTRGQDWQKADHWDAAVYERVFLQSSAATVWENWNSIRGDPGLPFHHLPVVAALRKAAAAAAAEQDFLPAVRLTLKAAVIAGQTQQAEHCSRCLRGAAQELCSLHGHIEALICAGNEQTNSFSSTMDWERLQGEAAITYDKAMQSMVIAALPLCNKGISQEVEGLLVQLRIIRLDADSWRSAAVLLSQLGCCVHYCMACTAGTCWSVIAQELDSESNVTA